MIFNMVGGSSCSQAETFFLRIGGGLNIQNAQFNINGMFLTEPNYVIGTGDTGDAYEIPVLSMPNTYEGKTYNVCIIMSNRYMFRETDYIPEVKYQIYSYTYAYYFNAVPGQTYRLYVTLD